MKHLFITGASRGIGYETAVAGARMGVKITATARSSEELKKLKNESPDLIDIIVADLADIEGVRTITRHFRKKNHNLDGIVHNAGLLINKPFPELTDDDWQRVIDVNLMGPVRLTRDLLEMLHDGSHILNISSMGGFQGSSKFPGLSAYSTIKGALNILTECLAVELKDRKISVNSLCLGSVQTDMLQKAFPGIEAPVTANEMGSYIAGYVLNNHKFYNGKILPVSLFDPG